MTQNNTPTLKTRLIRQLESCWLIVAILALITSVMCIAVAFLALALPGEHIAMLAFLMASIALGITGRWSMSKLRKRIRQHHQLVH